MSKRKICCFCERWASGGIESFLYNILQQMDLDQIEIDIVAAELNRNDLTAQLESKGVQFVQLSGSLHNLPANHRMFRRLLRQRQYVAVHLHIYQGLSLYYCRIARQEGVPVRIAHSHNEALRKSNTRAIKMLLHRFGRRCFTADATHLWACSQAAAQFLYAPSVLEQNGFTFIPNGIDTDRFRFKSEVRQTIRTELGLENCLVLGNVGRLCSQKNQIFLLEVFAQLIKIQPRSRLLLVGDGDSRSMLEQRAVELGIRAQVIFYGRSEKVEQLLWAMDVFALPSLFEGLSLAAVEAQAAGLPILCAQGLSEEVKLTANLRFLPLDAGASIWAEAVLSMASQENDRAHCAQVVKSAGFEASAVAQYITDTYLGRKNAAAKDFNHRSNL